MTSILRRMSDQSPSILGYGRSAPAKPLRLWVPVAVLSLALLAWNRPRLTPTFFPDRRDLTMLVVLAPAAFAMARWSSMPGWALGAFGAIGVALFLLANLNDNNFRAYTSASEVLMPWCAMVAAGGLAGGVIALAARRAGR